MKDTATQRALIYLYEHAGAAGVGAIDVGYAVWGETRSGRISSANGGGDYAAQMLLGRLKKAGLVEYAPSEGSTRWRLSRQGLQEIKEPASPKHRASDPAAQLAAKTYARMQHPAQAERLKTAFASTPAEFGRAAVATRRGGAVVDQADPCSCGHAPEAHGRDPEYPGSTACTVCADCVAYEADPEGAA